MMGESLGGLLALYVGFWRRVFPARRDRFTLRYGGTTDLVESGIADADLKAVPERLWLDIGDQEKAREYRGKIPPAVFRDAEHLSGSSAKRPQISGIPLQNRSRPGNTTESKLECQICPALLEQLYTKTVQP